MKVLKVALPIVVLLAGAGVFVLLKETKPEAAKDERSDPGTLVQVAEVQGGNQKIWVDAKGTVQPAREVTLGAEVTGKVRQLATGLSAGAHYRRGDLLVRIDAGDFRLALQQQQAMVESAQTQLEIEQGRKKIAEKEWELFNEGKQEPSSGLTTREPQIRSARTGLDSARSGLNLAKRAVSKTMIRAPFDGVVRASAVQSDQIVGPGTPMLTYVATDAYHVKVSIPFDRLAWIDLPSTDGRAPGAKVVVRQRVDKDSHIVREGRIIRLLSDVEPGGRMARLLVEIKDPLEAQVDEAKIAEVSEDELRASPLPMLLGAFVEVSIEGHEVEDSMEIPRKSLRSGDSVYLYQDGALTMKHVEVLWKRKDTVLVSSGLSLGDKVIITPVSSAVEGMKVRLQGDSVDEPRAEQALPEQTDTPTGAEPQEAKGAS